MKCPGQDSRYWKPGSIFETRCPKCDATVEFFKDDTTRRCDACGHRFANPKMDFGCASYCQFADDCLGSLPPELMAQREDLMKDRIALEMKKYFNKDFKRIGHAMRVARYAEEIGKAEGGNMAVVLASAYLHDIGIHEAERKYGSTASKYQELEGPAIVESILKSVGTAQPMIDEVCDIVGHHHHPRKEESINFMALYDADLIANIEDNHKNRLIDKEKVMETIRRSFLTETGRKIAEKYLLNVKEDR